VSKTLNILTIGGATQDMFIKYDNPEIMHLHTTRGKQSFLLLAEGGKVEVSEIFYSSGGGANNTAISFDKLGFDVATVIKVGGDEAGTFVLRKLKEAGVSTEHVIISHDGQTGLSFIIPSLTSDRTVLAFRGINAEMTEQEVPFDSFSKYDLLYITSLSGDSSQLLLPIVKQAKTLKIPCATNPGISQLTAGAPMLRQSLPFLDILILNAHEAKIFMLSLVATSEHLKKSLKTGPNKKASPTPSLLQQSIAVEDIWFSLNNFFQEVMAHGPKIVVVTNGSEGVYVAYEDKIYYHPSLPISVINTVGAGDAFGSSFVGSYLAHKSIEQAIVNGIINAASVISFMDTKQGLLSMQELEKRAQKLDSKLLQKFALKEH
jgi:sugar/nucleoside kinase (ribokinase family)